MADLTTKSKRKALPAFTKTGKPHIGPHWQRLSEGAAHGFRKSSETWLARYRNREGVQEYLALGGPLEFDEARKAAEGWLAQMGGAAVRSPTRGTVKDALQAYVDGLNDEGRADAATEAGGRFALLVYDDPLAKVTLERAKKEDFTEWRKRVLKGTGSRGESRTPRSVNRHVRSVVAALNYAHAEKGYIGNPATWKIKRLSDPNATKTEDETPLFLDAAQRKALIAAATPAAQDFFRGLELTGARPKELAEAKARHFDGKRLRLAHRKGRQVELKSRQLRLDAEGIAFFERIRGVKGDDESLFTEDGTQTWRRHKWARAIRSAVAAHNKDAKVEDRLPATGVGAYAFRHARISELLQIHKKDPLTVAQQTGTSLVMIEKFYFKFIDRDVQQTLADVKS